MHRRNHGDIFTAVVCILFLLLLVVSPEQWVSLSDAATHHQAAANESCVTPLRPTSFHQRNIFPLAAH